MDFSPLKLEIHLNRMQKVSCYRTMQIPSLMTVLFGENAGVLNRKITRKHTKRTAVKLFNIETGRTYSNHFVLSYENLGAWL
jgi:hypothetical protein